MRKIYIFAPIFILSLIAVSIVMPAVTMSEHISEQVFRMHILANSDSAADQEVKLRVRDELLEISEDLFCNCQSADEAVRISQANIDLFASSAEKTLRSRGFADEVTVSVTKEYFDTRFYDNFTLPAGVYHALKVEIGEAKGHNWWCVMFPSVCISGCTEDFDESLTPQEREMIESGRYAVRFKVVEIVEKIKTKL